MATLAHAHAADGPHALGWTWEPWFVVTLVLVAGAYLAGCLRLSHAGILHKLPGWARIASFCAGVASLVIALASPLDALAEQFFSAHMTQHMLLMLVAPPLLVWGQPALVWLWAFPLPARKRIGRLWVSGGRLRQVHDFLMQPVLVWLAASGALWFWHAPGPYDWALSNEAVHIVEHLTFFITALALWTLTIEPVGPRRIGYGGALVLLGTFALHNGLLGALLTFAPKPLYPSGASAAAGLSALEDQQLAGLIMWVPAGLVHLMALVLLFAGWLASVRPYASAPA